MSNSPPVGKQGVINRLWASAPFRTWLVLAAVAGGVVGLGLFTFTFAQGASYLSDDPASCINCHVMRDQYDGWGHGSHTLTYDEGIAEASMVTIGKLENTPVGTIWIAATDKGLAATSLWGDKNRFLAEVTRLTGEVPETGSNPGPFVTAAKNELDAYFRGELRDFTR